MTRIDQAKETINQASEMEYTHAVVFLLANIVGSLAVICDVFMAATGMRFKYDMGDNHDK